jgi:hypothetical protein
MLRIMRPRRAVDSASRRAVSVPVVVQALEPRRLFALGTLSEQIIVDQFGWRADAPRKVALFADPIAGQNSAVSYTPGASFHVRRASDDAIVFTGSTVAWKAGATHTVSGDKVWSGDFSTFTTPGEYYLHDPTRNLRSFNFRLDNNLYNAILRTSGRTFFYQRQGQAIASTHGGNWTHAADHLGPNQDSQARLWQNGAVVAGSAVRDLRGGWWDAGDYNKYVPFTTNVIWNLLQAYEWNAGAHGDNWNTPQSGNGTPDALDEVKWELDWLLRMQNTNGSVINRVASATYNAGNSDPSTDTQARYYTAATTWATASFAASAAHAARVFQPFNATYAATLQAAAVKAWNYLSATPNMTPSNGSDGGTGLAAAPAGSDAGMDFRLRVLAAAELYKTSGGAAYKTYFEANYKHTAGSSGSFHPLLGSWTRFDPTAATELNRAYVTYATTSGANASIVTEIKTSLRHMVDDVILAEHANQSDPYRSFMWDGHYTWGSNQLKSEWANLLTYAVKLNVNSANTAKYREVAEEYLHYFHGRNPLSYVYLSNIGSKGANLGGDKSPMQVYHSWFGDGSSKYDGAGSTYGPVPGYLVGGPNQFFSLDWISPPHGEPPQKAFRDWNTAWNATRGANENSWEITEPAIYYQAAYQLLLSQFSTTPAAPATGSIAGTLWNDTDADGVKDTGEPALSGWRVYVDADGDGAYDAGEPTVLTSTSGAYAIAGLAAGTHRVRQVLQSGWRATSPSGGSYSVTLAAGAASTGKNFGNTRNLLISGVAFNDLDGDGTKDSGEAGLADVRVYIDADHDGVFDATELSTLSKSTGSYTFRTLAAGTHRVRSVLPSGWRRTTPTAGYVDVTLPAGGTATNQRIGHTQRVLISGTVFNDANGDRAKNSGEVGLSGWRVFIDADLDGVSTPPSGAR